MKFCSQLLRTLSICAFLFLSVQAKAQIQDTVLVDYTGSFCLICSDPDYDCKGTDSLKFVDSTSSTLRLYKLKFVFLHTPCTSSPTTLFLNGDTMGSWNNSYSCACNSCTIDTIEVTGSKIGSYMQNDTNTFLFKGGSNLCIARYMIIRTWVSAADYDMATNRLVSPFFQCAGSQDIEVEIANFGKKQVDSVELHWTYNGVTQTTVKDTGTIDTLGGSGSFLKTVKLGSKTLVSGQTDTLVAWTEKPNGQSDTVNSNDTITAFIRPALKDTLTVGGTSPDFTKIQDAFDALMLYGVCGPVVLNIRTGTYNEQLVLGKIPGADTTNTVTLRSETGDSTDVKVYFSGTSSMNHVLQLDQASYFRCRELTLEATGSSYARVVSFFAGNQDIAFNNCRIIGTTTSGTGTGQALFYSSPGSQPASHNIQITNCRFERGSYGFYFNNPYNDHGMGYRIERCDFVDQSHRNIQCHYSRDVNINYNNISRSSSGTSYGHNIYINDCQGPVRIGCNVVTSLTSGTGIEVSWQGGDTSNQTYIFNNFVSVTSPYSSSCIPLRLYYANYVRVAHNSLFAECAYSSNNAIYSYYGSNIAFTGNSVFNKNPGKAWYNEFSTSGSPNVIHSNHNNLYTLGSSLGFWNTSVTDLTAWQTTTGQDSNSVSADPGYKSTTDLHASAVEMNGAADPTSGITDDIDKEPRDTVRPDIGADEYKLPPVDASLTELKKFKADSSCIQVVLRNLGDDTLKTVTIAWTFDGVTQTSHSWTGALLSGDTAIVCVGYKKFKRDSAHDIRLWTSSPNGVTDTINHNDTIDKRVFPALCGIYTIGGTSPDYTTFNAALDALDSAGVLDSAVFRVRDGTYNEQLHITEIECVDHKDQVIFESESGDSTKVTLSTTSASWSSNYLIWLDGADGITFRKMNLKNTSTWYKRVVYLSNGAHYNELSNNIIENNDSTSSSSSYVLVYNESTADHNFCLVNNRLHKGSYGYYGRGSFSDHDRSTLIRGNIFERQGYAAVEGLYLKDLRLLSNRMSSTSTNYWASVNLDECSGQNRIEKNNLIGPNLSERYGFYLNDFDYGDTTWILNNFASVGGTNTSCYPYHIEDFTMAMFYNNSALCYTSDTNSSGAVFFEGGSFNSMNNNLICTNGGYGIYRNWGTLTSDYNNVRTPSAKFSYWGGTTYANLAAHITGTSNDSNSISQDPQYVSNSDLHITSPAMDMTGKSVPFVTDDFDGDARDTVPDIGADEFEPAKYDIGVTAFISPGTEFAADTQNIKVVVYNFGTDTIFSGTVRTRFNTDTLPDKAFADTIPSGDSIHVTVGKYLFKADTLYTFMAWTWKPNGVTDQQMSNDTFKVKDKLAAMRGEYTIGGSSPDFTTFKLAIEALKLRGVVDSVKFKVRDGTYTEQLVIPEIQGASAKNTIIFEGESKDSSLAKLTFASTKWDTNYTVRLNGADGITFRHLTLEATGTSYGKVIVFENESDHLCIENCQVNGVNISTSSSNYYLITSGSQADNGFVLRNSLLKDGSTALYFDAPWTYSQRETGTVISGNTFNNFYAYGIYLNYQRGVKIIGNTIRTNSTTSGYQLIYLYYPTDTFCITRNKLIHENNGTGIYCYYGGYSSGDSCLITNNTISIGNMTSSYYGIYNYYPRGLRIAHNSVNLIGSNSGSYCLGMSGGGSSNIVLNNIFENQTGGYTMYYTSPSAITQCNNNNARTSGSQFGYYNSGGIASLTAWRSTSGFDSSSTEFDPMFAASDDLHISGVDLDGTVPRLPYVLTDIDNENRDSVADVGADEIRLKGLDAGIAKILVPNQPFKSDTQYVKVVLKNYGSSTLYSADINWVFNADTTKVYKWADTLESKDTAWVCIEKKFFDLDSTYSLKAWTSKPNNGTDSLATNDTAETVDQYPALSGQYTIGGASPSFVDFSAALTALKRGGIVDSVIFTVRNGTYNEQITIPRIIGATKKNSIVFQSSGTSNTANVILTYTATSWTNNWVVKLDSAVGITFRRITITNPGSSYSTIVEMRNNADYNEFNSCVFTGNTLVNTTSSYRYLVNAYVANNHNNDYNCFVGNTFTNGSVGIYTYGYNSGTYDKNWVIKNNQFDNQYYMGTYQRYADSIMVHGNQAEHAGTYRTSNNYAFYHQYIQGGFTFTSNVSKGTYARAAYLPSCDGISSKYGLIANNMLHTSHSGAYGLYLDNSDYVYIYNNNIHTSSTGSNRAMYSYYGTNQHLVNNILVESGSGYAWYQYGGSSSFTRIDHNDYFGAGTNLAYYNFSNRSNFAALKSATGKDTNSLNVDPSFVDTDDLHVREITLDEAGTPLSLVPFDIDLDTRDSTKPDIGADEFEPPAPEDAGILAFHGPMSPFKSGAQNVEVVLKNFGSDTLTSATIQWTVNGISPGNHSWTGSLLPGKVDTVNIGSYTFDKVKEHDMVFWTSLPNGVADTLNYNDTAKADDVYAALDTVYTIGSSGADFPNFTTAAGVLQKAGILDTVTFKVQSGTYNEQFSISSYSGQSASRPITFESLTGDSTDVVLTHNSTYTNNYLVKLDGAPYITFRNMTFKPTNYYYSHCIDLSGGSHGTQILNNRFDCYTNPYYYHSIAVWSNTDNDDSCRIENNYFTQGNQAIQLYGLGSGSPEKGTIIRNNRIEDGARDAIYLQNQENLLVTGNTIRLKNNSSSKSGIQINNAKNGMEVSCNDIASAGIYDHGIYVNYDGSVSQTGLLVNNFVALKNNSGSRYGIYTSYSEYLIVAFNSVNIYGGTATSTYAFRCQYGSDIQVKNNIFCNRNNGYAYYQFGTGVVQSDYNDLYTTGTNLGYYSGNITSLSGWQSATGKDANSMSIDPLFTANDNLHVYISSLDSAATPITGVTQDIDKDTRNTTHPDIGADEFNSLLHNLGVSAITKPVDGCDIDSQLVEIQIFNYGSQPQTNYSVCYSVDGGTAIKDTITDTIGPGVTKSYTFGTKHKFATHKTYSISAWTKLGTDQDATNDTTTASVTNYATPGAVSSMFPLDTTKNVDYPITLSWAPSSGTSTYDVYIWDDTASARPTSPFKGDLTQISTQITSGLTYGRTFKWQVVSKNAACGTDGPIQKFTMRYLPDLMVEDVSVPATAFSGNSISISWKIKNVGGGPTGSRSWYDLVYLSTDTILDNGDLYVGGKSNPSALNASSNYSQSMSVTLPNGYTGTYHAIVKTDAYSNIVEANEGNNAGSDTSTMVVSLTPPPDLIVTTIVRPKVAISGTTININYTVKNDGTGSTRNGSWYDYIYWSADTTFGASATYLKSLRRTSDLDKDSTYTFATQINVPHFIQGKHYVYVKTDGANQEYEHTSETNNVTRSDTIGVILAPPPDLVVRNVEMSDTVSSCARELIEFETINQGGGHTMRGFNDLVYYSTSNVYSTSTITGLGSTYTGTLQSKDTADKSVTVTIPDHLVGKYYLYVVTDAYNRINEDVFENNNVSPLDSFVVEVPDLIVSSVRTSKRDTTGDTTLIHYTILNQGAGDAASKSSIDRIYISTLDTFNLDSCVQIKDVSVAAAITSGDSVQRTAEVTIPNGFDGNRYFYVHTDFTDKIFEDTKENNNTGGSDTVKITLAPYPDLLPQIISIPDTANAGDTATITFTVKNQGDTIAKANWMDRIYLSKDSVFQPTSDPLLASILHTADLKKDSMYSTSHLLTIPSSTPAGDYYYFVVTDSDDNVYEHQGDNNNVARGGEEYIDGYPPIDLKVMSVTSPDTFYSGKSSTVSWTVKNIGEAATVASYWEDCIYLSTDSFWSTGDTRIHTEQINSTVSKDSSYNVSATFTMPNGLSGDYYVLVRADKHDSNNDADTSNNTGGKREGAEFATAKVLLTPPPDLQISLQDVPSTGTSGQQIHVVWKVTNKGSGPTINGYWNDQIYLSTDYTIDNSDRRIGNKVRTGDLLKDSCYTDSMDVFIPGNYTGNYILIIVTDAENREYEFDKENNNTALSILTISKSPPADLIVSSVTKVDSVVSGDVISVGWAVKNIGINPAAGYLRDNIYLSADSTVDATDKLLATKNYYISLVKDDSITNSESVTITGVALGDYYVLVKTDVLNNINEANDTNNTGKSTTLNVNIPELFINVKKPDSLDNQKEKLYRLHVHDSLEGESMLITLKGDSVSGNNEMYIRRGEVPSRSEFDYGYSDPFQGNQEIIVPELDTGTYYLMVYGNTTAGSSQAIELLARILEFEIRKVTPTSGGNTGFVTLKIEGSKFDADTKFFIGDEEIRRGKTEDTLGHRYSETGEIDTDTFLLIDPTVAYVVFDLREMEKDTYDVIAEKGDTLLETTSLKNGFEVVDGVPVDIDLNVTRPANARTNRIVSFSVEFTNKGNTDVVGADLLLISNGTTPIALTVDGLSDNKTSLNIPLQENEGIPNRLRPGASGSVKVYSKASNTLGFSIVLPE